MTATGRRDDLLRRRFGPLEVAVLEALWSRGSETSVRTLSIEFPRIAYTTLMTTLDRLFKKGVLVRRREGRAFLYAPLHDSGETETRIARAAIDALLAGRVDGWSARPVLSSFVDAVGQLDDEMLDELERMVRERRDASARARDDEREDG